MASKDGPHTRRSHGQQVNRGSRKRIRRIVWWENTSVEFWIFVVNVVLMLLVALPPMLKYPPADLHHVTATDPR